ncbi:MAG: hypothetical protein ACRDNE_02085 [Gaiellaceae bacterium]
MHGSGTPTITQVIVDRIGELVEEVEDLPGCWTGTMGTETRRDYRQPEWPATCTDSWEGELRFVVDENGVIEGAAGPRCWMSRARIRRTQPKRPSSPWGESTDGALVLRLSFGRNTPRDGLQMGGFAERPPLEIPKRDDCTAQGDVTVTGTVVPFEDPTVARATFDLRCPDDG